jgi:PAS domain-containing protein
MVAGHPGAQNEEVLVRRSDGRDLWCLGTWWPVHDDEGVIVAYLHRFTEYTQRRHFLDRLRESESELQRAQRIAVLGSWRWTSPPATCGGRTTSTPSTASTAAPSGRRGTPSSTSCTPTTVTRSPRRSWRR